MYYISEIGTGTSVHLIYAICSTLCIIIPDFAFHLHEIETSFQAFSLYEISNFRSCLDFLERSVFSNFVMLFHVRRD